MRESLKPSGDIINTKPMYSRVVAKHISSKNAEHTVRKILFLNQCREETIELEVINGIIWGP